jgi:predicted MPP superfamily phosphohydrolase
MDRRLRLNCTRVKTINSNAIFDVLKARLVGVTLQHNPAIWLESRPYPHQLRL